MTPEHSSEKVKTKEVDNVPITDIEITNSEDDEETENQEETLKSKAEESNAMKKLSDVVEEKQLDENKMKEAFLALRKQEEADKEAERKRYISIHEFSCYLSIFDIN
jgi:hypothetical protein